MRNRARWKVFHAISRLDLIFWSFWQLLWCHCRFLWLWKRFRSLPFLVIFSPKSLLENLFSHFDEASPLDFDLIYFFEVQLFIIFFFAGRSFLIWNRLGVVFEEGGLGHGQVEWVASFSSLSYSFVISFNAHWCSFPIE